MIIDYFFCEVFLDATKIAVNSYASFKILLLCF